MPREHLLQIKRLADREGLMIHMHMAQGDREMKQTALFNKIKYRDPTVMPAWDVLRLRPTRWPRAWPRTRCIGTWCSWRQWRAADCSSGRFNKRRRIGGP